MSDISSIRDEVDAEMQAWRSSATQVVLVILVVVGLPLELYAIFGKTAAFPRSMAFTFAGLLAALLIPRRSHHLRTAVLFSSLYALAIAQLASNGLVGDGRIALLALPLLATVLLGGTAGWIAAGISATALAIFTVLAGSWGPGRWEDVRWKSVDPGFWLLQSFVLIGTLVPIMVLLARFLATQIRTTTAERQARRSLEEESTLRRRLEFEILRVSEEEQRRIGSELHDGLCQHLTAALLHCKALENRLADEHLPQSVPASRLRAIIEESIGMAYDASKGLCPLDLNPGSLAIALERLAQQTHELTGLACATHTEGPVAILDPQQALHLFRIAQEAVTNAVKHANCREIQIELASAADALTLRVEDDGIGLRPGPDRGVGGLGLQLMRYRADATGGDLTIDHPVSGGTVVTCRVPIQHQQDGQA